MESFCAIAAPHRTAVPPFGSKAGVAQVGKPDQQMPPLPPLWPPFAHDRIFAKQIVGNFDAVIAIPLAAGLSQKQGEQAAAPVIVQPQT